MEDRYIVLCTVTLIQETKQNTKKQRSKNQTKNTKHKNNTNTQNQKQTTISRSRPRRAMSHTAPCSSFGRPVGLRYHVENQNRFRQKFTRSYLTPKRKRKVHEVSKTNGLTQSDPFSVCTPQSVQQQVQQLHTVTPQTKTRT